MKIVVLENNADRRQAMAASLADRLYPFETRFFSTPREAIHYLRTHLHETIAISLDHDMELLANEDGSFTDPGSGRDVAEFLAGKQPVCPVIIHTTNSNAAAGMELLLRESGWPTHRVAPWWDPEWVSGQWIKTVRAAILTTARERVSP